MNLGLLLLIAYGISENIEAQSEVELEKKQMESILETMVKNGRVTELEVGRAKRAIASIVEEEKKFIREDPHQPVIESRKKE